jgi:hypothetical protein
VDKLTEIMDAKRREIAPFARAVTDAELAAFAGKHASFYLLIFLARLN